MLGQLWASLAQPVATLSWPPAHEWVLIYISHPDSLVQIADVFHEKSTEEDTCVLRADTICTRKCTHTVENTFFQRMQDLSWRGLPYPSLQVPPPNAAPVVATTHSHELHTLGA